MPAKKSIKSTAAKKTSSKSSDKLAIGIDMGGTSVKLGVCRGGELLFHADSLPTADYKGAKELLKAMTDSILSLRKAAPGIKAVGVGVPGFADVNTGMVHNLTNVPGWKGVALNKVLSKAAGIPCFAENDANAMAYAEYLHGAGKTSRNMVAVTLGTGVGGALVIDGKLYRGSFSGAGEIGQMSIDYRGKPGAYGNTGGLEEYLGNREVAARAREIYQAAGKSLNDYSPSFISAAAKKGDPLALQVWDEFTTQLACALSNCVWLLNPDMIVIGGGVAKAGSLIMTPLKRKMAAQLAKPFKEHLKIVPAQFGNEAGIIGSAAVALERC
jgi:glucokinase